MFDVLFIFVLLFMMILILGFKRLVIFLIFFGLFFFIKIIVLCMNIGWILNFENFLLCFFVIVRVECFDVLNKILVFFFVLLF